MAHEMILLASLLLLVGCGRQLPPPPEQPVPMATTTTSPAKPLDRSIPGLNFDDVSEHFANMGYPLTLQTRDPAFAEANGVDPFTLSNNDDKLFGVKSSVFISATNPTAIRTIDVRVILMTDSLKFTEAAADLFSAAATLPFGGSVPDEAKAWTLAAIGTNDSAVFGSVKFQAFSNDRSCSLAMRPAQ